MREELKLRPLWLSQWPGHVTLVEPSIGSTFGAPDASLVADYFTPGWVEFKAMDKEGWFKMRPEQRAWARDFMKHSRRCALVIMDSEGFYIAHAREVLSYKPLYHGPSLSSLWGKILWSDIHKKNLPKFLELCYVAAE